MPQIDEYDPNNIKLAHIVRYDVRDEDLLYLKQISLRWVLLRYGDGDPHVDRVREVQERFARYGLQIYGAGHAAYRSRKIQLGQLGRDEDIETYRICRRHRTRPHPAVGGGRGIPAGRGGLLHHLHADLAAPGYERGLKERSWTEKTREF